MGNSYVVAIGTVCFDKYFLADHWIHEGDKLVIRPEEIRAGGMIANAACVLAGLGNKVYLMDTMPYNENGSHLLQELTSYGVDVSYINFDNDVKEVSAIVILTPKDRTVLVVEGGVKKRVLNSLQKELLLGAKYIYTTMTEFRKFENANDLADLLRSRGVKIAFDVESTSFESSNDPLFSKANIIYFNRNSYSKYCAGRTHHECATELLAGGLDRLVITLGEGGSLARDSNEERRVLPFDLPVVDATGAGDTFNAAFLHTVLFEKDLFYSLQFANAAASLAVSTKGARSGVRSQEVILDLMNRNSGKHLG